MKLLKPIIPSGSEQSIDREMREGGKKKKRQTIEAGCRKGSAIKQDHLINRAAPFLLPLSFPGESGHGNRHALCPLKGMEGKAV